MVLELKIELFSGSTLLLLTAFCLADLVQGDWDREREEITRWSQAETEMQMLLHKLGLEKTSGSLGPKEQGPM